MLQCYYRESRSHGHPANMIPCYHGHVLLSQCRWWQNIILSNNLNLAFRSIGKMSCCPLPMDLMWFLRKSSTLHSIVFWPLWWSSFRLAKYQLTLLQTSKDSIKRVYHSLSYEMPFGFQPFTVEYNLSQWDRCLTKASVIHVNNLLTNTIILCSVGEETF